MSASVGFEFAEQLGFECVLGNELNPTRAKWSQEKFPNAEVDQESFTDPIVSRFPKQESSIYILQKRFYFCTLLNSSN